MDDLFEFHLQQLALGITEPVAELAIGAQENPRRRVYLQDADAGQVEDRAEQFFTRVQSLFVFPAFGVVESDADDARRFPAAAVAGEEGLASGQRPTRIPVGEFRAELVLKLAVAARVEGGLDHSHHLYAVIRVNQSERTVQ